MIQQDSAGFSGVQQDSAGFSTPPPPPSFGMRSNVKHGSAGLSRAQQGIPGADGIPSADAILSAGETNRKTSETQQKNDRKTTKKRQKHYRKTTENHRKPQKNHRKTIGKPPPSPRTRRPGDFRYWIGLWVEARHRGPCGSGHDRGSGAWEALDRSEA